MTTGMYPEERRVGPTAVILLNDRMFRRGVIGVDPGIDRHRAGNAQAGAVGNLDVLAVTIETESLTYFARCEGGAVLEHAVVAALNIVRVPIARPPAHHVRGRRHARSALTAAPGIVDVSDITVG